MRASLLFVLFSIFLLSCEKQVEDYQLESVEDYLPLQPGKYRTYRTDSTVFTNFGRNVETHSYEEKNVVDALITDAAGKPAYRINRFMKPVNGSTWAAAGTYMISVNAKTAEVVENNLRIVKLSQPLKTESSWKGNSYLPEKPYSSMYNFLSIADLKDWNYQITSSGETLSLNGKTFNDVVTITAIDASYNYPVTTNQAFAFRTYAVEKYSKGVGLVYQELVMWEYQPVTASNPGYLGFGVKRSLIDFN